MLCMLENDYEKKLKNWPLFDVEKRLAAYRKVLSQELQSKGIHFDFHLWVSEEWFCPDGVPGFALPFYLFNKELGAYHKKQTGLYEGKNTKEILKLMRHELGHAIDNAYGLRKIKRRIKVFGSSSREYPEAYAPKAHSRNFVNYLGDQYAQSHPDEDFAETFAYWLDPEKNWQTKKFNSTLRGKFELMQEMMLNLRGQKPKLKNKFKIDPIEKCNLTPSEFYKQFNAERNHRHMRRVDHHIRCFFGDKKLQEGDLSLAHYLKNHREYFVRTLSSSEGVYQYEANWALQKVIQRAKGLGARGSKTEFDRKSTTLLKQSFRYLKEKDQLQFYL